MFVRLDVLKWMIDVRQGALKIFKHASKTVKLNKKNANKNLY